MNDRIAFSKLNNQVKSLTFELDKKKKKISNLEFSYVELQNKYEELRSKYLILYSKEVEYQKLQSNLREKDNLISDLEQELIKFRKKYENEKRDFNTKYQHDIREVQFLNGKLNLRNENTIKIEKLNDLLYHQTLQLEQKILNFKNEEKSRIHERELEFEKRTNEIKKRMLDYIREGKSLKEKSDLDQYQILQKFSIMNHNTLLNELEFESLQLEDLLKQRQHLDNIILKMKCDLEIHKKVEKKLINKNKKYTDMIRFLSIKADENKIADNNNNDKKNDIKIEINKIEEDTVSFPESSKNYLSKKIKHYINKNNNMDKKGFNKEELNKTQPLMKKITISSIKKLDNLSSKFKYLNRNNSAILDNCENKKIIKKEKPILEKVDLQRDLIKKTKELEDLKSLCDFYKEKLDIINDKYKNIIILFDEALEKIYEEKAIEDLKDVYIDIEEFKKCKFEKLSQEKRYSIIFLLIQYLLPLINENNLPENLKIKIKNVNTKLYLNETSDSSKLKKDYSFSGKKVKINENDLNKIKNTMLYRKYRNKKNNNLNINNIKRFVVPLINGNASYDNLRKSYSAFFGNINPSSDFTSF